MIPFPGQPKRIPAPRVGPGTREDIGPVNAAFVALAQRAMKTNGPPGVFATLARHRRLFRPWLRFAGRLMPRGTLPRRETELVILRVSVVCGSDYEWSHHVRLGGKAGLSDDEIRRVADGPDAEGWSAGDRALLRAVDELVSDQVIGDATWQQLAADHDEKALIELCLLAGHYVMLAGTLNSLGVQPDHAV